MANNRIRFSNDFILKDKKVGINTTEPRAELDVGGNLYVSGVSVFEDKIGIGKTNPTEAIDIEGNILVSNLTSSKDLYVSGISTLGFITASNLYISGITTLSKLDIGVDKNTFTTVDGNVGIGTTNPTAKLDVLGHTELDTLNVSIAATIPNLTLSNSGIAVTAILDEDDLISNRVDALATQQSIKKYVDDKLSTEIGDVSLEFSTDSGIGTVNLATEIFDIKGTANEIETVGSGVTLTIGLPDDVTISNNLTINRDVLIKRNLEIYGNITIGGTSAVVNVDELRVKDKDIVLGITTDAFGNDISTDFTANSGGIAIASTEGYPLVDLYIAGIETVPSTYKKIMWFKRNSFSGLGTDAWLSNYAIGIGSTQVPNNVRLAVGGVQVTDNEIIKISNINASGIITASQFIGTASTASFATTAFSLDGFDPDTTEVGFARTAVDVIGGIGSITSLSVSGISTLGTVEISSGIVTATSGIVTYYGDFRGDLVGTASTASFATTAFTLNDRVESEFNVAFAQTAGIATNVIGGIGSITSLDVSGITTLGTVEISSGIVTATSGIVTYYGDGSKLENVIASSGNATYATNAGIATNIKGGTGGNVLYQSAENSTNFVANGLPQSVLLFNGTDPIWANIRAATGYFGGVTVYDEGNIVGFADSITAFNFVGPNISATTFENTGIATITFNENIVGSGLSISGISTLGGVEISLGIITSSNPGVTTVVYYGDGSNLEGVTAFYVDAQINSNDPVYPTLAAGVGVNSVGISTNNLVFIESTSRLGIGTTNPTSTLTVGGDISLVGVETYTTTIQSITATADRYISFPDQTGVVALVQGINGAVQYNNAGYSDGGNLGYGNTTGTFGYIAGGGSITQQTNKSTGIALTAPCGRITMNTENLSPGTPVTFTMTNDSISANDLLILNHVSGGTAGSYALNAQCSAGYADINVTNVGLSTLGQAIVIGFAVIKTTI